MAIEKQDAKTAVATLEDVAAHAGVSTATVSRCLNAPQRVSEKTRTRVMEAVRTLGYAPNFGAQALAAKRTNTFGAIIPTMENAIFARGLQAFEDELATHGITMLVASSSYDREREAAQIRSLVARGADALLLIGHDRAEDSYDFLEARQVPYVSAWAFNGEVGPKSIGFDNRKAMSVLTDEVLALGHRRLALITASRAGNDRARHRWQGVTDALQSRGLAPDSLALIETPYSIANGARAFEELMRQTPRPTAILCGNDVLAAGAIKAANSMDINVPGDVSITGFDDIEIAELITPALTTVHVPDSEMGAGAATMLVKMRLGEDPGPNIELEAQVRRRDSLGPVPI